MLAWQEAELSRQWRGAQRCVVRVEPTILHRSASPDSDGEAAAVAKAYREMMAAGRPSQTEDSCSERVPDEIIGGVAHLHDIASAGLGERMYRPGGGAGRSGLPLDGDACRGVHGGWLPAEPGSWDPKVGRVRHHVGYREGSAAWRRHAHEASQCAEVRVEMRDDRDRASRFFGEKAEQADVEAAADDRHFRARDATAARAVERRRLASSNPLLAEALVGGRKAHDAGSTLAAASGRRATRSEAVGYRPGSAAARRAAGGLYESIGPYEGSHSSRLTMVEEQRLRQQEAGAKERVQRREEAQRQEDIAADMQRARQELQAARMIGSHDFGDRIDRIAARSTLHFKLNQPLAPYEPCAKAAWELKRNPQLWPPPKVSDDDL